MLDSQSIETRKRRNRHYVPHRDADGWYVHVGNGAAVKCRLVSGQITYYDGEATIHQFLSDATHGC